MLYQNNGEICAVGSATCDGDSTSYVEPTCIGVGPWFFDFSQDVKWFELDDLDGDYGILEVFAAELSRQCLFQLLGGEASRLYRSSQGQRDKAARVYLVLPGQRRFLIDDNADLLPRLQRRGSLRRRLQCLQLCRGYWNCVNAAAPHDE